jgi:hypothetical protein
MNHPSPATAISPLRQRLIDDMNVLMLERWPGTSRHFELEQRGGGRAAMLAYLIYWPLLEAA